MSENNKLSEIEERENELDAILGDAVRFLQKYGFNSLNLDVIENESGYAANAFVHDEEANCMSHRFNIPKTRRVTLEEIEKEFGCQIEIVL